MSLIRADKPPARPEPRYRACALRHCEPSRMLFGIPYGVCPLRQACPDTITCGYAFTLQVRRAQSEA